MLKKFEAKLNLEKCVFVVTAKKFLGFMVSQNGIQANLEKIKAIIEIKQISSMKIMQILIGRIVALN